jgi:hypothetical protein
MVNNLNDVLLDKDGKPIGQPAPAAPERSFGDALMERATKDPVTGVARFNEINPGIERVADTMYGKLPADPLREAFNNGIPLDQVRNPSAMIDRAVAAGVSPSGSVSPSAPQPPVQQGVQQVVPPESVAKGPLNRDSVPGMTASEMRNYRGESPIPANAAQPEGMSAIVDRLIAEKRSRMEWERGTGEYNAGHAAELDGLIRAIEAGRKMVDPNTGLPMISDLQAADALDAASKTNLRYSTTNSDIGATIARALGQPDRTDPGKYGTGNEPYRVSQAVQQSIPDWLGSIAKGQTNITAGENVNQERAATVSAAAKASSDRMDVQQQKDAQTGDIRAQNIVDASGRIIGYRAGGKDRYLSATELETLNGAGGGSATYGAASTKPAAKAAPAAAPVQRTAQDEAAIQWAQANPGSPQAAAILKRNGM